MPLKYPLILRETRTKCLRGLIASLRGTRNLAVYDILSRFQRSARLALHHDQRLIPCFFCLLLCCAPAQAYEKAKASELDLIELLGELDDEDQASLEAAMTEIETKKTSKRQSKPAKNDASIGGKQ